VLTKHGRGTAVAPGPFPQPRVARRRGGPAARRARTASAGFVPAAKCAGIVGELDANAPQFAHTLLARDITR
jgi:hypothetical protein